MVLISLEGYNEKDRLQERGGYLDDLSPVLGFGDMEEFLVRVEIVREPLYYPPSRNRTTTLFSIFSKMPPYTHWGSILTLKDFRPKINLLMIGVSWFSGEG